IFFPIGGHGPDIHLEDGRPSYPATEAKDGFPPITIIARITPANDGRVRIEGIVVDNEIVKDVQINDHRNPIERPGCSEWSFTLSTESGQPSALVAVAKDAAGNTEKVPHQILVPSR